MCQCHRLRFLQMREARHIGFQVLFHNTYQDRLELLQFFFDLRNLAANIKLHIQRHLIVTAAPGMQFLAGVPDHIRQIGFHKAVNIFIFIGDHKTAVFQFFPDSGQAFYDRIFFL